MLKMNQAYFPNVALRLPLAREVTPCSWVSDPEDLSGTDCGGGTDGVGSLSGREFVLLKVFVSVFLREKSMG